MMKTNKFLILVATFAWSFHGSAQGEKMNLEQCIQYALENHISIKNAGLDLEQARLDVKETIAIGLPQINGEVQLIDNLEVQTQFLPNEAPFGDPSIPLDVLPAKFGIQFSGMANATLTQLLFDGSYFVGLKAAREYKSLSEISVNQSKISVVENVTKAFYLLAINKERVKLLTQNKSQLEKLYNDSKVLLDNGFIERVDLQRTEVSINNLDVNISKINNAVLVSEALLKFQMGMKQADNLEVDFDFSALESDLSMNDAEVDPTNRIEHKLLIQRKNLQELDVKNEKVKMLPSMNAFGTLGANVGAVNGGDLFAFGDWASYSLIGVNLQVPIFSSFRRKHRIDKSRVVLSQVENDLVQLQNAIEFEFLEKKLAYEDNVKTIETQKKTVELAQEVYNTMKIKYDEGVASNFELVQTETELQEAQTNYFESLYSAVVSKVELEKTKGTLYQF